MENKIVLYFTGGSMLSVFGAGVATTFEDYDLYPIISAVYGSSAGIMTGAYFLTRQTRLGSSIYWEDLSRNFISKKDFFIGVWQRLLNRIVKAEPQNKFRDALDIDYLINIIKNKKPFNVERLMTQKIPIYAKFLNIDTHDFEYLDVRSRNLFDILKMAISPFPYVHNLMKIDDKRLIDASVVDTIGIHDILTRHPDDKILVILNRPADVKLFSKIKNSIEGRFLEWMFNDAALYQLDSSAEERLKNDLVIIGKTPRVHLITPSELLPVTTSTTSAEKLKRTYELGIRAGKAAVRIFQENEVE